MKEYLGDSVYAEFDGHGIVLTTENGMGPSNTIVLEPEIIKALNQFVGRIMSNPSDPAWTPFNSKNPELGMNIEVMMDVHHCVEIGTVVSIRDLGSGWLGIDTDTHTGVAVRPSYNWRIKP